MYVCTDSVFVLNSLQLKELLAGMCKDVHEKEDYTLRYLMTEQLKAEEGKEPDIVMIET